MQDANNVAKSLKDEKHLQHLLLTAFQQSISSIVITDADFNNGGPHIILCNAEFSRMTGYDASELIGQNPRILQGPETDRALIDKLMNCLISGDFFHGQTINYQKDGTPYVVEWNISAIYDDDGKICNYVSVQSNRSAQVKAEQERDILAKALHDNSDCVVVTDELGLVVFVNKGFEELTGYSSSDVVGKPPDFLMLSNSEQQPPQKLEALESKPISIDYRNYVVLRKRDGSLAYMTNNVTSVKSDNGQSACNVFIGNDITSQRRQQKNLEHLAQTDQLTGLLNRHAGEVVIKNAFNLSSSNNSTFSIIIADLDYFKKINDRFGHAVGDLTLTRVAFLLKDAVGNRNFCIRWGGEEFLIVLMHDLLPEAKKLAERIRLKVENLEDELIGRISMSFGVGQWLSTESTRDLINRVDRALYEAKGAGRNRVVIAH